MKAEEESFCRLSYFLVSFAKVSFFFLSREFLEGLIFLSLSTEIFRFSLTIFLFLLIRFAVSLEGTIIGSVLIGN